MKTTLEQTSEAINEYIDSLTSNELVNLHNTYCQNNNYCDDEIFCNDEEFFNMFFDGKVIEAVRATCYGNYNYSQSYVKFNGYGNIESFTDPIEYIDIAAIIADIQENPENYNIEFNEQ